MYLSSILYFTLKLLTSSPYLFGNSENSFTSPTPFFVLRNYKRAKKVVVIFGAGQTGVATKRILEHNTKNSFTVAAFIDDDKKKHNKSVDGVKVISFEEFKDDLASFNTPEMADVLFESITAGIKKGRKRVNVCDVEIAGKREVMRLTSVREDWPLALEGCMKVFIKFEEYEKCTEIQNLLKEYESKKIVDEKK